jgi:hypothetical protein
MASHKRSVPYVTDEVKSGIIAHWSEDCEVTGTETIVKSLSLKKIRRAAVRRTVAALSVGLGQDRHFAAQNTARNFDPRHSRARGFVFKIRRFLNREPNHRRTTVSTHRYYLYTHWQAEDCQDICSHFFDNSCGCSSIERPNSKEPDVFQVFCWASS